MASNSVGLPAGSPPPVRAATSTFLISLANILPRLASMTAFLCLVVAHFEWPDMDDLRSNPRLGSGNGRTGLPKPPSLPRRAASTPTASTGDDQTKIKPRQRYADGTPHAHAADSPDRRDREQGPLVGRQRFPDPPALDAPRGAMRQPAVALSHPHGDDRVANHLDEQRIEPQTHAV